jgi:hypothetical protein
VSWGPAAVLTCWPPAGQLPFSEPAALTRMARMWPVPGSSQATSASPFDSCTILGLTSAPGVATARPPPGQPEDTPVDTKRWIITWVAVDQVT